MKNLNFCFHIKRFVYDVYRMTNPSERSSQILKQVAQRYIENTKQSDEKTKINNALNIVRPKIKHLIDEDEDWTDFNNRAQSDGYYSQRHHIEYKNSPQLMLLGSQKMPTEARNLINESSRENNLLLHGILPEIDWAYVSADKQFLYWSVKMRNPLLKTIEFENDVLSVGVAVPPKDFFMASRSKYILLVGSGHELIAFYVNIESTYAESGDITLEPIQHTIPCQNIHSERIVHNENMRTFVGWKSGKIKQVEFKTNKSWFTQKTKKTTEASDQNYSFMQSIIPSFLTSKKDVEQIDIDNKKNMMYTLNFLDFNHKMDIRPWVIEIYHLGPFGKEFTSVTSIQQNELDRKIRKKASLKKDHFSQIASLHHISLDESNQVDLMLVTKNGSRIIIRLETLEYATDKLMNRSGLDFTKYYDQKPTGEWDVVSVIFPPLLKDMPTSKTYGCARIDLFSQDSFILKSRFSNGLTLLSGVDYLNEKEILAYIDDSQWYLKHDKDVLFTKPQSKFWTIYLGEGKRLLDFQKKQTNDYAKVHLEKV